jgi:dolichol kinase
MISTFICALLFSKIAVVVGLLFLTFGDTVAHLIGKSGKIKVWAKTVEGGIAFLVIGIIIVLLIPEIEFFPGAICAFVACIVELFPKIDDNLAIPLIACPLIHFLL